jgi:ubiquinone/menaquinone biosynthesis C-methylase UbiE
MDELVKYSDSVYGVEIETERADIARTMTGCEVVSCDLSNMPYDDEFFDLIFCNEVLEHTDDDIAVLREFRRVLKKEGSLAIYVPNRWFPIETHGATIWDIDISKPLFLNYLPLRVRDIFCKAARVYTCRTIKNALAAAGMEIYHLSYVYPAFDKTERKHFIMSQIMRCITEWMEKTPIRLFGISIFLIARKSK